MEDRRGRDRRSNECSHLRELSSELASSTRRLRNIVERSPDAYLVIDESGIIRFVNQAALSLFDLPESRLVGQPFGYPLIEGETTELDIVSPGCGGRIAEMRVVETDWMGEKAHVAALRDITDRKRAEQALQASERRLALALKAGGSAAWEMDVESETLLPADDELLYSMLGYASQELKTSSDWMALIHDEDRTKALRIIDAVIAGQRDGFWLELRLRAKDGGWRWIQSQGVPTGRNAQGRAIRLVGTHTDITARKAVEEEVRRLNIDLERRVAERTAELERSREALAYSNAELERFAHAAAHDLQAPLRSILAFSRMLQGKLAGQGDTETDQWLGHIVTGTTRLQTLIHDLLTYTRVDSRQRPPVPVNLGRTVDEAIAALAALISAAGAEVERGELPEVLADPTLMGQLMQNLIENGIKYNQARPPRVTVGATRLDGVWRISVTDNGLGINPAHHQRIFEAFQRLHSHSEIPGTGIGLATCVRIVQRHGGRIWVESSPGRGSTFHFTLPLRPLPAG